MGQESTSGQELSLNDEDLTKIAARVIELLKNGADPNAPPGQQAKGVHPRSMQAQAIVPSYDAPVQSSNVAPEEPVESAQEPQDSVSSTDTRPVKEENPFFWGAATVATVYLAAPLVRPALRAAVKGGVRLKQYGEEAASAAKEEFEDLVAEMAVDLSESSK